MTSAGAGKPQFMDAYRDIYGRGDRTDDDYREIQAVYYGMTSRTDDQLRRVIEAVDSAGHGAQTGWIYEPKSCLQHERPDLVGKATCVRTTRWSFIHRLYEQDELYGRVADPYETTNLIGAPGHESMEAELRSTLLDWYLDTTDVIPWAADPRFPEINHGYR